MSPSITSWTRIEGRQRNEEMGTALLALTADPFWFLARQWMVGEFTARDAGSPVVARLEGSSARLDRYHPGLVDAASAAQSRDLDVWAIPIAAAAERERVHETYDAGAPRTWPRTYQDASTNVRVAGEAGQHLQRLLRANGVGAYSGALAGTFPLPAPTEQERNTLDGASARWLGVMAGRVPDGAWLYEVFSPLRNPTTGEVERLPRQPVVRAGDRPRVRAAATAWLKWYEALFSEPPQREQSPWVPERMEYQFAVSAPAPSSASAPGASDVVLEAPEYGGDSVDWYSFNVRPGYSLGSATPLANPYTFVRTVIPTPLRYPGMPEPGWWTMEDARVNLGAVEAGPEDLSRMLLVEYALVYGNDWFLIPVEVDAGSLCRVTALVVTDSFGRQTSIPHYTQVDGAESPWRFLALTETQPQGMAGAGTRDVFFLPSSLPVFLEGRPVEDVLFLRDEIANMAWAVERVVESVSGRPLDRFEAIQEARQRRDQQRRPSSTPAPLAPLAPLVYRLTSGVPENWIPLIPQQVGAPGGRVSIRLLRGEVLPALEDGGVPTPLGRILEADRALSLYEETVPRSGARVIRSYCLARTADGSTTLWSARRADIGRGEGPSGLRWDIVEATGQQA